MIEVVEVPHLAPKSISLYKATCDCGCVFKFDETDWEWSGGPGVRDNDIHCPICNRLLSPIGDKIEFEGTREVLPQSPQKRRIND